MSHTYSTNLANSCITTVHILFNRFAHSAGALQFTRFRKVHLRNCRNCTLLVFAARLSKLHFFRTTFEIAVYFFSRRDFRKCSLLVVEIAVYSFSWRDFWNCSLLVFAPQALSNPHKSSKNASPEPPKCSNKRKNDSFFECDSRR